MKYVIIFYVIVIIYFAFRAYKNNKIQKERSAHIAEVQQQMEENGNDAVDSIVNKCFSELDKLMEYPIFLSDYDRFEYLRSGHMSRTEAYDYVVNHGWTPKKYIYILLMQMIRSDATPYSPRGGIKSNRKKYDYLNESLYKDGLISYEEMERNEFLFMETVVKNK